VKDDKQNTETRIWYVRYPGIWSTAIYMQRGWIGKRNSAASFKV